MFFHIYVSLSGVYHPFGGRFDVIICDLNLPSQAIDIGELRSYGLLMFLLNRGPKGLVTPKVYKDQWDGLRDIGLDDQNRKVRCLMTLFAFYLTRVYKSRASTNTKSDFELTGRPQHL